MNKSNSYVIFMVFLLKLEVNYEKLLVIDTFLPGFNNCKIRSHFVNIFAIHVP